MSNARGVATLPPLTRLWTRLLLSLTVTVSVGLAPYIGKLRVPLFAPLLDLFPLSIREVAIIFATAAMSIVAVYVQFRGSDNIPVRNIRAKFSVAITVAIGLLAVLLILNLKTVTRVPFEGGAATASFVTGYSDSKYPPCAGKSKAECIRDVTGFDLPRIEKAFDEHEIRSAELFLIISYVGFMSTLAYLAALTILNVAAGQRRGARRRAPIQQTMGMNDGAVGANAPSDGDAALSRKLGKESKVRSAFISYSWDDDSHRDWVRALAQRLRADGVDVSIDRWAAVPGDQLSAFMERAIRDNHFVIVICTPRYKLRSDNRQGGVGYEGDIMTAEIMTSQNHRKFIPVLRKGTWPEAAPSWLLGKYYINLSGDPYPERDYEDLVRTLLGIRETAPPVGRPMSTIASKTNPQPVLSEFEDIKITRVVVEEVTEPRNDGTPGGALYSVPFALSASPPPEWAELFVENWNHPLRFTTMHRPGIASVEGSIIMLDGTTIEEVERYHRDTLQLAVAETNRQYRELLRESEQRRIRVNSQREEHRKRIKDTSNRIKFD